MNNELDFLGPDFVEILENQNAKKEKPSAYISPHNEKRLARRKSSAEDFTPSELVNEMLNKLPEDQWEKGKTFCDPACENGNMLVEVLRRKLSKGHNYLEAVSTIYGVDIMKENTEECRLRLFMVIKEHLKAKKQKLSKAQELELIKVLGKNIFLLSQDTYPNGALDEKWKFDFDKELPEYVAIARQKNYNNEKELSKYGFPLA